MAINGNNRGRRFMRKLMSLSILLAILGYLGLMVYMNGRPELPTLQEETATPSGHATVSMVAGLMQAQLDGPGGWLPNDLPLSPGYWLDNMPSFQLGVLTVVRHSGRVLRDNLSRQRTSDELNKEADKAYSQYSNDPLKWALPSAEGAFGRGNEFLLRFRENLGGSANFYPRADNLIQMLEQFVSELGGVSTLMLDAHDGNKVSWFQVDNNFYFGQGVAHGMLGMMRAARVDFNRVLSDKNALEITDQIITALEGSQFDPWYVGNGDKDGVFANHSNNLKAYIDDARQKMKSLMSILDQG